MLSVVDIGISNLASVTRAFERVGAPVTVCAKADNIRGASAVVLPGVGAFGDAMKALSERGFVPALQDAAAGGVPVLGICLGMQLMAEQSAEFGPHQGLGLIAGHVERLAPSEPGYRVPNMGWDLATPRRKSVLFPEGAGGVFYHVHSYHLEPNDEDVTCATIDYSGREIVVAVERDNLFGVQFHPEKSQDDGLAVLDGFVRYLRREGRLD